MKRPDRITKVLDMPPSAWAALDRLAEQTNSLATKGSRLGCPSWRAMIRRLAQGELGLLAPEQGEKLPDNEPIGTAKAKYLWSTDPPSSSSPSPATTTEPHS